MTSYLCIEVYTHTNLKTHRPTVKAIHADLNFSSTILTILCIGIEIYIITQDKAVVLPPTFSMISAPNNLS